MTASTFTGDENIGRQSAGLLLMNDRGVDDPGGVSMNTVLLIHHSRRIRRQLRLILAGRFEIVAVRSAAAAERLLRNSKPDVVLVDRDGHGRGAGDLIARWRLEHIRMPVVALSRFEASRGALAVRRRGASAVVRWPGPVKQLLGAIARARALANADR